MTTLTNSKKTDQITDQEKAEKTDPDEKPWIIAYTLLWRKEKDALKLRK